MRLNEGKIGMQESASIAAVAITACSVFLLDSEKAYSRGDATFISLPVSIAVSLAMFMLMWYAMRRTGARNLNELFDMCAGKAIGTVLSIVAALIFILYAYRLMARFCILIHGRVFAAAEYESVALWIAVPVAYAAIKGLECLSRLAKIFGVLIGALVLISLIIMISAYDVSRLAPFPGDLGKLGMDTISRAADSVAAFLGLICVAGALQGGRNVKKSALIGSRVAMAFVFMIQFALGATFTYTDLSQMAMPIYLMKMVVMRESYLFRLDQMNLFFYMIAALIAAAYYIYCAALIITRRTSGQDIRPAVVGVSAFILAALRVNHRFEAGIIQRSIDFLYDYAFVAGAPFILAAIAGLIRFGRKGRAYEADK